MHRYDPPKLYRPGAYLNNIKPGIDLPTTFMDSIKGIDSNLYFVRHPYKVLYEGVIMNQYYGELDNPRYTIHEEFGQELWGFPLKQATSDAPVEENKIHIWRLCNPWGFAHITSIESTHSVYLDTLLRRLWLQSTIVDKYDGLTWSRMQRDERAAAMDKKQKDADELFETVQKENQWLIRKAHENYLSGNVNATNPEREIISSFKGQTNRTKIVRPLTDREGGLVGLD